MKDFEAVYHEYFHRVYCFLSKLCGDDSLCEEMTQETFFQAYLSFHRYDGSCDVFTWLAAIAKNTYFKYLRKNRIRPVNLELLANAEAEGTPEEAYVHRTEVKNVRDAVLRLPQKYRDVVMLRIYAELSFAEVARYLDINENSAKVIFHRAKKILKEDLDREYNV